MSRYETQCATYFQNDGSQSELIQKNITEEKSAS